MPGTGTIRVLIPFHTAALYGMEKAVIETFDCLRPEVEPLFLVSRTAETLRIPMLDELRQRGLSFSFYSDRGDWPRIGRPQSVGHLVSMLAGALRGNRDVLKASLGCDAIYLPAIAYAGYSVAAMLLYRATGKRVFHHFHELPTRAYRRISLLNWLTSDHLHNTDAGLRIAAGVNPGLLARRNYVLPQRIEIAPESHRGGLVIQEPVDARNLLFVGQVSAHKGLDLLLEAFDLVSKEIDGIRLNIVGGILDQRPRMNGMSGNNPILYWGYRKDIAAFLQSAYLYVHPSPPSRFAESYARSAIEAQAFGVPVVCFASGVLPQIIESGVTGVVCDRESPQCLAANLIKLLRDPKLRETMSCNARAKYNASFSREAVRSAWLECLRG